MSPFSLIVAFLVGRTAHFPITQQSSPGLASPAEEAEIRNLINGLVRQTAERQIFAGLSDATDVFSANGAGHEKSAAFRLADFGFRAIPQLISAIPDRRLTKCPGPLSVGDVAFQVIEQIAGRRFSNFWTPMSSTRISEYKGTAEKWWDEAKPIGELLALANAINTPGNQEGALRLVKRYPLQATELIRTTLLHHPDGLLPQNYISALSRSPDPRARIVLREQAESGFDTRSRVSAASVFRESDPEFTCRILYREWRQFRDRPEQDTSHESNWMDLKREDFINSLEQTGNLKLLKCLTTDLVRRPVVFRETFLWTDEDHILSKNPACVKELERAFVAELDDHEGNLSGSMNSAIFSNSELGDMAAFRLSELLPGKYPGSSNKLYVRRSELRKRLKAIYRDSTPSSRRKWKIQSRKNPAARAPKG